MELNKADHSKRQRQEIIAADSEFRCHGLIDDYDYGA